MYAKICRFGEISGYQERTKFLLYIKIKKRHFREIFGIQELQFIVHDLCRKKMSLCGDLEIFGEGNCGTCSKTCRVWEDFCATATAIRSSDPKQNKCHFGGILKPYFFNHEICLGNLLHLY